MRMMSRRAMGGMAVLVVSLWALGGCGDASSGTEASESNKITVICTTTMIADLARNLAGDAAEVVGIMKEGEDPHVYDVRPRDAQAIVAADLILMNGFYLESTLEAVIENNAEEAHVVRLAEAAGIEPLGGGAAPDPHCWFNVSYFRGYAEAARDALVEADPSNAEHYRERAAAYIAELDELHEWVGEQVSTIPPGRRVMVTSHDAFQYFGEAYDIDVYAVIGLSTEDQPSPRDMERLERLVRDRGVKALFVETSVSQTLNTMVEKIAAASGAGIGGTLYSDSLGPEGTEAGTYIGMVRHNTNTIVEALR